MSYTHKKYQAFAPIKKIDRRWPDQVIVKSPEWCAVDLRDGNQALVNPMNVEQKQRLFDLLVDIGVKQIEIGFPSASQPDFDFCRQLIEQKKIPDDVTIQVLTQARPELIEKTFKALDGAKQAIVHVYNSTSTVQRNKVFNMDREDIKAIAVNGAKQVKMWANKYPKTHWTFQYSPESFTGTELDYAVEVIDAVSEVWLPHKGQKMIINLPATVEMATPNVFADQVEWVIDNIKYRKNIIISLHTHNDRGCGVAAAELGIMAGADRIEGTLLGNGERTGNMDLITMAMNMYSQGIDPKLDFSDMATIVTTVESCTDIKIHPRHPYAGELVFTAFSGSHQDAIRKCLQADYSEQNDESPWEVAYLPIDPSDVGKRYEEVVRINSQSGKGGITHIMERDFNISLPRWAQIEFARKVQLHTENQGGEINSFAIKQLFDSHYLDIPFGWEISGFDLHKTSEGVDISIKFGTDNIISILKGHASGAVEAAVNCLSKRFNTDINILHFDEYAIGTGSDAQAMACVSMKVNSEIYSSAALAEDTTMATLQALFTAVGRAFATSNNSAATV